MAERWKGADAQPVNARRLWTPAEKAERTAILKSFAEALIEPIRQIDDERAAQHSVRRRPDLFPKMFRYGIPFPSALRRELTGPERGRLLQIMNDHADRDDELALALVGFLREFWGRPP